MRWMGLGYKESDINDLISKSKRYIRNLFFFSGFPHEVTLSSGPKLSTGHKNTLDKKFLGKTIKRLATNAQC